MKMPKELFKEWMEARPKTKNPKYGNFGSQNKAYKEAEEALDETKKRRTTNEKGFHLSSCFVCVG